MASAENETDLLAYVKRVKGAVIQSVEVMNPGVKIHDTGHFNHSAAPDLVLSWPGRKGERPLYVRRSYEELVAGRDVQRLAQLSPVFLSVGPTPGGDSDQSETRERLGVGTPETRSVLVTNAATVDLFTERPAPPSSPLAGAVAAEIFPSGQGLLDRQTAAPVVDGTADALTALSGVLNEQALASVAMVAGVVSAARGAAVPTTEGEIRPFTTQEARDLLPWLLQTNDVTGDDAFWQYIAERVTLRHLEELSEELLNVDISALCRRGWSMWRAQRAALGLVIRDDEGNRLSPNDGWFMRGRLLTYETGDAAVRFTTYGQGIKERGGVSSATWDAIQDGLADARLMQIVLRGLARSIRIEAAESGDATEDTSAVLSSVEDNYYIDEVTLRYGLADEDRRVRLLFGDQIAYGLGNATVKDLLTALAQVGAYRNPVDISALGI